MKLELYNIIPELMPYIKVISSIENSDNENSKSTFRVLPDTCVELFLSYNNGTIAKIKTKTHFDSSGSFVTSRMSTFMDVQILPNSGSVAVCFKTGAAYNFFNLPMKELTDNIICLSDLWGNRASELEEIIAICDNNKDRVLRIQQFLLKLLHNRFESNNEYEYCLWQINLYKGKIPVNVLSKKINISQRQLSRQFNAFLGLSPKEFSKITRFVFSLDNIKQNPADNLTQIAYESGYYDQAHYIHDCKEFTGLTPKELIVSTNLVC